MYPVENDYVDNIDNIPESDFKEMYVRQISEGAHSVLSDIRKDLNVPDNSHIQACNLNKRSVTKDKLILWLESVVFILDSSVSLLQNAVPKINRIGELQEEKIEDQARILELQRELILKREEELKAVHTTVEKEMKSYSSAVTKNCSAALSTKKIEAAVRKVVDKEDRSRNVVIYGLEESGNEKLQEKVESVLGRIGEKPVVKDCIRVGVNKPAVKLPRPIRFSLRNSDHVAQVLRNARRLHTEEGFRTIYICPDRTADERKAYKKLLEELREKRRSDPDRTYFIKNNRIVSRDKT